MMNIIESFGQLTLYGIATLAVSVGMTFFIAAIFFGPTEISKEEYDELLERRRD